MPVGPGGFDAVERGDGGPVVVEVVGGDGTVGRDRLALTDAGRRLGDAWLRECLSARGAAVADVTAAHLTGHLRRAVVAPAPAATDGTLSGPDLPVDAVRTAGGEPTGDSRERSRATDGGVARQRAGRERVRALRSAGRVPEDRAGLADALLASRARRAGAAALADGDVDAAREWFRTAAGEYCSALRRERDRYADARAVGEGWPLAVRDALYAAVLAGDDALVADAAREAALLPDAYYREHPATVAWFHYARLLATVALAPDPGVAAATGYAAEVADVEDPLSPLRPPVDEPGYPRVDRLAEALPSPLARLSRTRLAAAGTVYASDDPERVGERVAAVLSAFADATAGDGDPAADGEPGVSLDGVALLAVAARHGFDLVLEGPGLPAAAADLYRR